MCHGCVNGTEKFSLHEVQENEANHSQFSGQFSVKEERKPCWFDFNECCFCSSLACGFFHSHWNPFHSGLYPEKGERPVKKCTVVNFGAIQTNEVMIVINFPFLFLKVVVKIALIVLSFARNWLFKF